MKRLRFLFRPVLVFIFAQLAWLSLLGLWIYWYVSNYIIFNQVGDKISPQLVSAKTNILALIGGLVLLLAILFGMYLIFIYLNRQLNITRLYDNFIANVSHELKSPLASIQLYLETLHYRKVPRAKQREFFALMMKDANRLKNLINSILDISGLEKKRIAYNFHVHNAESVIRTVVEESAEQFRLQNAIQIKGSAPCQCVIDRDALKIVFDNLMDNAIKYSKEPAQISILLGCNPKSVVIEFKDQGIGIQEKDQKKIFTKFHRIYGPEIPNVKGTGLGLYWTEEIIKYHGGKISVSSEGLGHGSAFRIELPIYRAFRTHYSNHLLKLTQKREEQQVSSHEHE
jgi:two-component system phosphate regulon sensor histidine kinase PhoR